MKKIILFSIVVCSVIFHACKKDSTNTDTPVTQLPADTLDPSALSAEIVVAYSSNIKGDIPAASTDGPALISEGYDNHIYYAINKRYVIIYPQSTTGFIAGYYVKIDGADSYFKVDYSNAAGFRKANNKGQRENGDNADSSIVIKLPASIKGTTFSVKYAAYDSLNRVSSTQTAIVNLLTTDSSSNNLMKGNWKFSRLRIGTTNAWRDAPYYPVYAGVSCTNGVLTPCSGDCIEVLSSLEKDSTVYQFDGNNQFNYSYNYISNVLNWETSTCRSLVYDYYNNQATTSTGGYLYNATTKILTLIYDGSGSRDPKIDKSSFYTTQYKVLELSSVKLILYTTSYSYNAQNNVEYVNARYVEYLKQ